MSVRARHRHAAGQGTRKRPEAEFQTQVLDLARLCGWRLQYHTHDSRRSEPGFPDLVLVRGSEIVFAELKVDAPVTVDQRKWWLGLTCVSEAVKEAVKTAQAVQADGASVGNVTDLHGLPRVEAYIWRPTDWPEIEEALRRRS